MKGENRRRKKKEGKKIAPTRLEPGNSVINRLMDEGNRKGNNGDAPFQGKFQVNLLNDDTIRWNCATSSYGQIV